jgi:hypothetical protein
MNSNDVKNKSTQLLWPGRRVALRRILLIALVLFPCTWIVNAFLIGNWNLLADHNAESYRHLREAGTIFAAAVAIAFLITLLPQSQRFLKWISNPRTIRRAMILLLWIVTIIALFYGEEDWRGHRAWSKYSEALMAQGEQLDFKAFVPKAVPDAENFAAIPEIQSWFVRYTNDNPAALTNTLRGGVFEAANSRISSDPSKLPPRLTDLVAWQMAFDSMATNQAAPPDRFSSDKLDSESRAKAAPAVLAALKPLEPKFAELRMASARPQSVYPVVYYLNNPWGILLPHLAYIKGTCLRLDLRACAELAAGQNDRALEDVRLTLRLGDSLNTEPFLISYLVRIAVLQIASHSVWEGLAEHHWTEAQLNDLEEMFQRYNVIGDMKYPLDGERAAGILTPDLLSHGQFTLTELTGGNSSGGAAAASALGRILPGGWYDMEKLSYCRLYNLQLQGAFDPHDKRVFPTQVAANSKALNDAFAGRNPIDTIFIRHQLLSTILLPALANLPKRSAHGQVEVDETVLACALERYRLAHGQFPESLEALPAEYLSMPLHDPITGAAYKYRRDKDSFVLYSVGWNEIDDGGKVVLKGKAPDMPLSVGTLDAAEGDWVWQYPAK